MNTETTSAKPSAPGPLTLTNGLIRATISPGSHAEGESYYLASIELLLGTEWVVVLQGRDGAEFVTSLGSQNAADLTRTSPVACELAWHGPRWSAVETIELAADKAVLYRTQTYTFHETTSGSLSPGFLLPVDEHTRYTYPIQEHLSDPRDLDAIRIPADWALPFPFHIWQKPGWAGIYGLDLSLCEGTLAFQPAGQEGLVQLQSYFPGCTDCADPYPLRKGSSITLREIVAAQAVTAAQEPMLEMVRLAAGLLLREPVQIPDLDPIIARFHTFYHQCELWNPDAFGPGKGWFHNMWVRTDIGPAKKHGEMSGYFDLGWGEGIAVEMWMGMVRNWQRSGNTGLLPFVDEMTRNIDHFRRGTAPHAAYYDRSDGNRRGDFLMEYFPGERIWTHSLGHTGCQLLQLYQLAADYPAKETRERWLSAASSIAGFLADKQQDNGDLQDGFDAEDKEFNAKPHRIAARAVVCGLWVRMGEVTGDQVWVDRARRLAQAVAPEIAAYQYYNQMIDTASTAKLEAVDGEAACYALEGLVPLYRATADPAILRMCHQAAAFALLWTYFFDLPNAYNGVARGGQVCRTDIPLLYPIGPAKAVPPLLDLYRLTGDELWLTMVREMVHFIANWQLSAPGKPWDGGMVHALDQHNHRFWGPDLAGQVDTGMATGNSLAALETWLAFTKEG